MPTFEEWQEIGALLREPINAKSRPGRGGRSFSYITARDVMDRLDETVGPGNWGIAYKVFDVEKAIVECTLVVHDVSKADVGYPNNPDDPEDEPLKSAYSDALKRAAVHFGIGRFLYQAEAKPAQQRKPAEPRPQPAAPQAPACRDCGTVIVETQGRSPGEIATATTTRFGRMLCVPCARKEQAKQAQTQGTAA